MDEVFLTEYEKERMQEKLVNSTYKEGIKDRNIEIAKSMLEEKMNPSLISKITGLSIKEIKSLSVTN